MHRPRFVFSGIILVLLMISSAVPLAAANKEHQQMMADIRMLHEQAQQLQLTLAALTDVLKTVTSKMDSKIDEQAVANRKAFADQKLLVDTVAGELRVVREKADETNVRVASLSQEIESLRLAMPPPGAVIAVPTPTLTPDGATATTSPAPGTPLPPAPPTSPVPTPTSLGVSPQRAIETALADYYAGQWSLAIQGFEHYIKTFPKSDLADDAQWYIGESYFSWGKFKEAVAAYDRVITDYQASNQTPGAYYKRGMALTSLGQLQQARESFELVIKTYPNSDAAQLGKQQLDRLNRPGRE